MKLFIRNLQYVLLVLLFLPAHILQARFSQPYTYKLFAEADLILLIDPDAVTLHSPLNHGFAEFPVHEVAVQRAIALKGSLKPGGGTVYYSSEPYLEFSPPGEATARSRIVYLKYGEDSKLTPVNWVCSTFSSPLSREEIMDRWTGRDDDPQAFKVLCKLLANDLDKTSEEMLVQIVATGPPELTQAAWEDLGATSSRVDRLLLKQLAIGIWAKGPELFKDGIFLKTDFDGLRQNEQWGPLAGIAPYSVFRWMEANKRTSYDVNPFITFALAQSGTTTGQILAGCRVQFLPAGGWRDVFPMERIDDLEPLLKRPGADLSSQHTALWCLHDLLKQVPTPEWHTFEKDPQPFLDRAVEAIRQAKSEGVAK